MTKADRAAADRILKAACKETLRQIRRGEPRGHYRDVLKAATTAAGLLIDERGAS